MSDNYDADPAHVELARVFSSVLLLGPPMSRQLVEVVAHLFSPEEAEVARHLPYYYPRSLRAISRKAGRPAGEIEPLLEEMSRRRVIYGGRRGYSLLPLIPGMFEYLLMNGADSDWHREYARKITGLFGTGYVREYSGRSLPAVRNIPVQTVIEDKSRVADADLISEMIDAHTEFTVLNVCQCRQSISFSGGECKRSAPEDGCLVFGSFARAAAGNGSGRRVEKEEMRDIVAERWEKKLVFLTGNVSPSSPNAICTCCDCCCHFLEAVNHYEAGALVAPPHFKAKVDASLCDNCGKCTRACNTGAHVMESKVHYYYPEKCIGCGICVEVCNKANAITMVENPDYKPPSRDFQRLGLKLLPGLAMAGLKARFTR